MFAIDNILMALYKLNSPFGVIEPAALNAHCKWSKITALFVNYDDAKRVYRIPFFKIFAKIFTMPKHNNITSM